MQVVAYKHRRDYRDYVRGIDMGYMVSVESFDFEGRGCYMAFVERKGSEDID